MPRNSSGVYTLPGSNPVTPQTIIATSWANPTLTDIANELTNSLDRNGRGGMLSPFYIFDGTVNLPGIAFINELGAGLWRSGTNTVNMAIVGSNIMTWSPTGITSGVQHAVKGNFVLKFAGRHSWLFSTTSDQLNIMPSASIDAEDWNPDAAVVHSIGGGLGIGVPALTAYRFDLRTGGSNGVIAIIANLDTSTQNASVVGSGGVIRFSYGSGSANYGMIGGYTAATSTPGIGIWAGVASGAPQFIVSSTGNVGIGFNTPWTKLQVTGPLLLSSANSGVSGELEWSSDGTGWPLSLYTRTPAGVRNPLVGRLYDNPGQLLIGFGASTTRPTNGNGVTFAGNSGIQMGATGGFALNSQGGGGSIFYNWLGTMGAENYSEVWKTTPAGNFYCSAVQRAAPSLSAQINGGTWDWPTTSIHNKSAPAAPGTSIVIQSPAIGEIKRIWLQNSNLPTFTVSGGTFVWVGGVTPTAAAGLISFCCVDANFVFGSMVFS